MAAYAGFTRGPADPYVARLRDAATRDREAELWVATPDDGDEVLGCVTICPPGSTWRELAGPDEGEFRMLAVAPAARGRGVGQALVELVLEHFRAVGARAVVMSSPPDMTAAHRLYDRLGFVRTPGLDWSPVPDVPLLAYRKELSMESTLTFTVTDDDTAAALGSGSLPVLGTPRLLAWCEAATCAALGPLLPEGGTSVGTRVSLEHLAASPVGQEVEVTASSAHVDGRLHRFTVSARHVGGSGRVVGSGEVTRVVVDADRFLSRL